MRSKGKEIEEDISRINPIYHLIYTRTNIYTVIDINRALNKFFKLKTNKLNLADLIFTVFLMSPITINDLILILRYI